MEEEKVALVKTSIPGVYTSTLKRRKGAIDITDLVRRLNNPLEKTEAKLKSGEALGPWPIIEEAELDNE